MVNPNSALRKNDHLLSTFEEFLECLAKVFGIFDELSLSPFDGTLVDIRGEIAAVGYFVDTIE